MVDELPDTDELSGIPMTEEVFGSRWHRDHKLVVTHLLKKHEGDLVELEGQWELRQGAVPDALFDPQFACKDEDFTFCKGLCKGGSYERSKYAADYKAWDHFGLTGWPARAR